MEKRFLFLILLLMHSIGFAWELTDEQKKADLVQLRDMIKSHYAPLELKKMHFGLSIDELYNQFEADVLATNSNSQYYYKIVEFVARFNDGHFSARIPTNHLALMPFNVEYVDGKVLISEIIRDLLPIESFPFEKGDEVVRVDDLTTEQYIEKYSVYRNQGNEVAKRALTAATLTKRAGAFMPSPGQSSTVYIKKEGNLSSVDVEVPWFHLGDPMDEFDMSVLMNFDESDKSENTFSLLRPKSPLSLVGDVSDYTTIHAKEFFEREIPESIGLGRELSLDSDYSLLAGNYHCSGKTRVKIPIDATIIMEDPVVAYYHPTPAGNIGYLRIPHYSFPNNDLAFLQYEYAIAELEQNTVGLVIDQDHNCGGSIDFLHKIVSLFMEEPFAPMPFSFLVNKVQVLAFMEMANHIPSNTLFGRDFNNVKNLIYNAWKAKLKFTPLTPFFGNTKMYGNPTHYTKPIVILIDYMSGSGGDAFPTIMQGLGRATLVGSQTMGLGGHVEQMPELNNSGIMINMTRSLFFSPSGVAVENNGAMPDIPYIVTKNDFLNEYEDYQKFYLDVLFDKIHNESNLGLNFSN